MWSDEGAEALDYLHGRDLSDETIRSAALGVVTEHQGDAAAKACDEAVAGLIPLALGAGPATWRGAAGRG